MQKKILEVEELGSLMHNRAGAEGAAGTGVGHGRYIANGTLKVFAAQALILPTGLLTAAFLTRQLGPEFYGIFTVAATIVLWVELSTTQVFSRTTVKFVAEATDWRAVASTLVQAQLVVSLGAATLLVAAAPALALWLRSPELATYLSLFALDIPIFALAHIHRSILVGRGAFGRPAQPQPQPPWPGSEQARRRWPSTGSAVLLSISSINRRVAAFFIVRLKLQMERLTTKVGTGGR